MKKIKLYKERIDQKLNEITNILSQSTVLGLFNGEAGKILFYGYLSLYYESDIYLDKTEDCLLNIFDKIEKNLTGTTFCSGLTGFFWGVEHLKRERLIEIDESCNFIVPELKLSALKYAESNNFDFLHGSSGIIYYLLDIDAVDEGFINSWLKLLDNYAYKIEGKYVWDMLFDKETGKRVYNLSLSHGISSIIIVLAEIVKKTPNNELAIDLLNGSVKYLLGCKNNEPNHNFFPSFIDETNSGISSRLAWCYGDLGNAVALWRAGNLLSNDYWKKQAIEVMLHSSYRKDLKKNGLVDAGICHGTSGIAHIFNRFYMETKIKEFDDARWYWLEKTFDMAKWPDGLAGYKSFSGEKGYQNEHNLLEGIVGIGMVLLGFLTEDIEDISWDRCLMLS